MSRLEFAPKLEEVQVTDIKKGLGSFVPKPHKPVSFAALKAALKKAGYTLDSAEITLTGILARDDAGWWIEVDGSKQRFALEGKNISRELADATAGARLEIIGDWQTVSSNAVAREVITVRSLKKIAAIEKPGTSELSLSAIQVSLVGTGSEPALFLAPIRTTSPGLAVYKGGAVAQEYSFTRQHLGPLKVDRHALLFSLSYTPTPRLQLAAEIPYGYTAFKNGLDSGSSHGLGNITLWGKYRFYRTLEMWGDRQAAVRFGVEMPTGKKGAPGENKLEAASFVRQQLTAINGGLSFHADTTYSKAKGRLIYGANIEGILRGRRDGYRLGHEMRINTDLEYVLFPFNYRRPTKELFTIFETTFIHRRRGQVDGVAVPGTTSTEFYIEPGLQYIATPQLAIEASYQIPVVRNTGPLVLRTDQNVLLRVKYLY